MKNRKIYTKNRPIKLSTINTEGHRRTCAEGKAVQTKLSCAKRAKISHVRGCKNRLTTCKVTRLMRNCTVVAKTWLQIQDISASTYHFTPISRDARLQELAKHDNLTRSRRNCLYCCSNVAANVFSTKDQ